MSNKHYIKGRKKEYRIKQKYELMGYDVIRSAGSHGFADLIAINRELRKIIFIQCKGPKFRDSEKRKLEEENQELNFVYQCSFEVI